MSEIRVDLPKPEVRGTGAVMYRCTECGEMMDPVEAVIVAQQSYHLDHAPEAPDNGR